MGFEPTRRFPDDSLANCSFNHSGTSPSQIEFANIQLFIFCANIFFKKMLKCIFYAPQPTQYE